MFTMNNYSEQDEEHLQTLDNVAYIVYGREIGEQGTPHLQGCVTFLKPVRKERAKTLLPGCHLTIPDMLTAARKYCKKGSGTADCPVDPDVYEWSRNKLKTYGQGQRSDLDSVTEYIKSGHTLKETAMEFSNQYVKFHAGIGRLTQLCQRTEPRTAPPVVHWYYGDTGTGKTRAVVESEPSLWLAYDNLTFFNGWENQDAACFDDFRGGFCKFRELLRLLDRYSVIVNIKHGTAEWNPYRIYVTSDRLPQVQYNKEVGDQNQLLRRITNIVRFSGGAEGTQRTVVKGVYNPGPGECNDTPVPYDPYAPGEEGDYGVSNTFNLI